MRATRGRIATCICAGAATRSSARRRRHLSARSTAARARGSRAERSTAPRRRNSSGPSSRCRACAHAFVTSQTAVASRMPHVCATASARSSRSSALFGASISCATRAAASSFQRPSPGSRGRSSSPAGVLQPFARSRAATEHGSRSMQVLPRRTARRRTTWPSRTSTRCSQSERSCAARRPSCAWHRSRPRRFSGWRRLFHRLG